VLRWFFENGGVSSTRPGITHQKVPDQNLVDTAVFEIDHVSKNSVAAAFCGFYACFVGFVGGAAADDGSEIDSC